MVRQPRRSKQAQHTRPPAKPAESSSEHAAKPVSADAKRADVARPSRRPSTTRKKASSTKKAAVPASPRKPATGTDDPLTPAMPSAPGKPAMPQDPRASANKTDIAAEFSPTSTPNVDHAADCLPADFEPMPTLRRATRDRFARLATLPRTLRLGRDRAIATVRTHAVAVAAVLIGLGAGWQFNGAVVIARAEVNPLPSTPAMLAVIGLLWMALGASLPGRALTLIGRVIRHRWHSRSNESSEPLATFWLMHSLGRGDAALPWLTLSVAAGIAGGAGLASLGLSRPALGLYRYLVGHFFWTAGTLTTVEWLGTAVVLAPLGLGFGLVVTTLAAVMRIGPIAEPLVWPDDGRLRRAARRPPSAMAPLLIGFAAASIAHHVYRTTAFMAEREMLAGVLPLFALAAFGAWLSQLADRDPVPRIDAQGGEVDFIVGGERFVRFAPTVWGIGCSLIASGWLACEAARSHSIWSAPASGIGAYLILLAIGVVAITPFVTRRHEASGACGMGLWISGVMAGVAATATARLPASATGSLIQATVLALAAGGSLQLIQTAWLARSPAKVIGFVHLIVSLLMGIAAGIAISQWGVMPALGPMGTLIAGSLALLAYGGLMQVYEEEDTGTHYRLQLSMIFASLAVAIALFPSNTRMWTRREHQVEMAEAGSLYAPWLQAFHPEARHLCLIGVDPQMAQAGPVDALVELDLMPMIAWPAGRSMNANMDRMHVLILPASRAMRLTTQPYHGVYVRGRALPPSVGDSFEYTAEWLSQMAGQCTPGGQLVLELPLTGLTPLSVRTIGATFAHAAGDPSADWALVQDRGRSYLLLRAEVQSVGPSTRRGLLPALSERSLPLRWHAIGPLFANASRAAPLHSLRRDALSPTLQGTPASPSAVAWLVRLDTKDR